MSQTTANSQSIVACQRGEGEQRENRGTKWREYIQEKERRMDEVRKSKESGQIKHQASHKGKPGIKPLKTELSVQTSGMLLSWDWQKKNRKGTSKVTEEKRHPSTKSQQRDVTGHPSPQNLPTMCCMSKRRETNHKRQQG